MTVVFDLLGAQNRDHGERGIARYVTSFALALQRRAPDAVNTFLVDRDLPIPDRLEPLIRRGLVQPFDRFRPPGDAASGVYLAGSLFEDERPLDRVLPVWARGPDWRTAAILYDLIPFRFAEIYLQDRLIRERYLARLEVLHSVDHLLAISQSSAHDAVELLGIPVERITVIGAGTDPRFDVPDRSSDVVADDLVRVLPGLRPGYVLFPSGIEPRKNNERLLTAYGALPSALRRQHQLVLMCTTTPTERTWLERRAAELGVGQELLITGFVSDQVLVGLYQAAALVVFPSLYEGFGLPVLEARRCGAPVICSDTSSLREVLPDPTARFDPRDVRSITAALRRSLADPVERRRLQSLPVPPFSWERAAERTLAALRPGVAERRAARPRRRRLAVVTPLPPAQSGVAAYAGRLLPHVAAEVDLTIFTDLPHRGASEVVGAEVRSTTELEAVERAGGAFDEVVYFLGNSHFHISALQLLRRRPGVVLLHDVRLTGLYSATFRHPSQALPDRTVGHTLARLYPERYRRDVEDLDTIEHDVASRFGILLVKEVAELATELLVHSSFAASLVQLDCGRRPEVAYPHPLPAILAQDDRRDLADAPMIIGSFGIVSPIKRPSLLIGALRHVRTQLPEAELRFVGAVDANTERELLRAAIELDLLEVVSITGHVDDERFAVELSQAAVAVQLRAQSNGESSGAVAEAMAAGVPTIVSDLGAMSELPDESVLKVSIEIDERALAQVLVDLLTDGERRRMLAAGANRYAAANRYEAAGKRFLQLVLDRR